MQVIGLLVLAYHAAMLAADAKQVKANVRRYRTRPSRENLIRLAVAEGVLIKDVGQFL